MYEVNNLSGERTDLYFLLLCAFLFVAHLVQFPVGDTYL